jgi:hypothetical protein
MTRKVISLIISVVILSSCGNKTAKNTASTTDQPVKVEFAALTANPADYIGKNIVVEGKVVHVCPHTGKKLFVVGENPDIMLYVQAGDSNEKFPMELQGSKISVEGRLERVAGAEKPASEPAAMGMEIEKSGCSEMCADTAKKEKEECETEAALAKQTAIADLVMVYTRHTVVK